MKNHLYDHDFYKRRNRMTRGSAEKILGIILPELGRCRSALDIGCGVGVWLSVLKDNGFDKVRGFDGGWVERSLLEISEEEFLEKDLEAELQVKDAFDLGICLEVLEHLSEQSALQKVDVLTTCCDIVLFSAAVPGQGGKGHINERPQSYWCEQFESRGFVGFDYIRPRIWMDESMPLWYRQNTILFVRQERADSLSEKVKGAHIGEDSLVDIIHPDFFAERMQKEKARRKGKGIKGRIKKAFRGKNG